MDVARARGYRKRGGGSEHVAVDDQLRAPEPGRDLVALDDALRALAVIDERKANVVELRFFGGLSNEEAADALGVSSKTVMREWQVAKVWLLRELTSGRRAAPGPLRYERRTFTTVASNGSARRRSTRRRSNVTPTIARRCSTPPAGRIGRCGPKWNPCSPAHRPRLHFMETSAIEAVADELGRGFDEALAGTQLGRLRRGGVARVWRHGRRVPRARHPAAA